MFLNEKVKVLETREVLPGHRVIHMYLPRVAENAHPGQFLHIRCSDTLDPLLRRPISIHAVDRETGKVSILYRVAGRGTARLENFSRIDVLGPLGNGFKLPASGEKILAVGGGIGAAPMYFLLQELSRRGQRAAVFLGALSAGQLLLAEEIESLGHRVTVATDDGSAGRHGPVTGLCTPEVMSVAGEVFACGPRPMLKALAGILARYGSPGQVALEERMGCGLGACLSCACKTRAESAEGFRYSHVCVDGPVFAASEVIWE